jgi:hypothetical protein
VAAKAGVQQAPAPTDGDDAIHDSIFLGFAASRPPRRVQAPSCCPVYEKMKVYCGLNFRNLCVLEATPKKARLQAAVAERSQSRKKNTENTS